MWDDDKKVGGQSLMLFSEGKMKNVWTIFGGELGGMEERRISRNNF